jgi:cysteine desulfurase
MEQDAVRIRPLRDKLERALLHTGEANLNGDNDHRLPNVSNIAFKWAQGDGLIISLHKNIAVSSGAACTSATPEPSYVLKALGLDDESAKGSIRFSLGRFNTEEEIDYTIQEVTNRLEALKKTRTLFTETNS